MLTTRRRALLLGLLSLLPAPAVRAQAADPAVAQVQKLVAALLKSMKAGRTQSTVERYRTLEPVITQVFALPLMLRLAVGPDWDKLTPGQQQEALAAFTRYTVANYAHNFNEFGGQRFEVEESAQSRGREKLVSSRILATDGSVTSLVYRMREVQGEWRVLDVYSDGVSMLTLRRTDFVAALGAGGPPELIAYLKRTGDNLLR